MTVMMQNFSLFELHQTREFIIRKKSKAYIVVMVSIVYCKCVILFQAETALNKQLKLKATVKGFRDQLDEHTSLVENHKSM